MAIPLCVNRSYRACRRRSSPTAVVLRRGRVVAAYAFSDVRLLRSEVGKAGQPVHEKEAV